MWITRTNSNPNLWLKPNLIISLTVPYPPNTCFSVRVGLGTSWHCTRWHVHQKVLDAESPSARRRLRLSAECGTWSTRRRQRVLTADVEDSVAGWRWSKEHRPVWRGGRRTWPAPRCGWTGSPGRVVCDRIRWCALVPGDFPGRCVSWACVSRGRALSPRWTRPWGATAADCPSSSRCRHAASTTGWKRPRSARPVPAPSALTTATAWTRDAGRPAAAVGIELGCRWPASLGDEIRATVVVPPQAQFESAPVPTVWIRRRLSKTTTQSSQ